MATEGSPDSAGVQSPPAGTLGLRTLVVDDEVPALEELAWLLRRDERVSEVTTATSGADALRALEHATIDVVFCDINMPGLSGMDVARVINRFAQRPQIVFVTAHDHHAVDAFALEATDYVMKPVREDRLAEAVRRVVAGAADPPSADDQTRAAEPIEDETIPVELGGVTRFITRSQVRYAQAQGDYARLHTHEGSHLVRIPLTTLEERWEAAGFARIHRSTLVALHHVHEVRMEQGRCTVVLDDVELQVSRRHTRELRERLLRVNRNLT